MTGGGCPFLQQQHAFAGIRNYPGLPSSEEQRAYYQALQSIDWSAVKRDLQTLLRTTSQEWPADYGHYGGLFIRMAWHAAGTYRLSDGRGGAEGGCQRFEPELSWPDNTNLVHAHRLLEPIKAKYGKGLSWGDLLVLAGTVAIEDMGGPVLGFAAGRIDHINNAQTVGLGPSEEQERFQPVTDDMNGMAPAPLGQNTMGLIYVNPEGPMGQPDPVGAAHTIRDVFGRMGMTEDREVVALIGGGHTFGKCHGAGLEGPGPTPAECPHNPYPGLHGTGKGNDTVTSGLEGPWTTHPTQFDNEYFTNLLQYQWEPHRGPGGRWQWRVVLDGTGKAPPMAPPAHTGGSPQPIMMLTTDVALAVDPAYRVYVEEFARDVQAFADAFAHVWYKLVHRDMGPVTRLVVWTHPYCKGSTGSAGDATVAVPPQSWQYPLPEPLPARWAADHSAVLTAIRTWLAQSPPAQTRECIRLARNAAYTFRHTDYLGGVNGARIRFAPGKDWPVNVGLDRTLAALAPIQRQFEAQGLTWADLIVLAGTVAVQNVAAMSSHHPHQMTLEWLFYPGRSDATDGAGWEALSYMNAEPPTTVQQVADRHALRGLSEQEFVVLQCPEFPTVTALRQWYVAPFTAAAALPDNNNDDDGSTLIPLVSRQMNELQAQALKHHPPFQRWVEYYLDAGDAKYMQDFVAAWIKIMNADRFDLDPSSHCAPPIRLLPQQQSQHAPLSLQARL